MMRPIRQSGTAAGLMCLALSLQSVPAAAADSDVAEMKRAIEELQAQNRALAKRLATLETEKSEAGAKPVQKTAQKTVRAAPAPKMAQQTPPPASTRTTGPEVQPKTARPESAEKTEIQPAAVENTQKLEQRIKDLEIAQSAQEDATRSVIRDTLSTLGSKINEFVTLGGSIETTAERFRDFTGPLRDTLTLSTAELDLDIKVNDWTTGNLVLAFDPGTSVSFPTTQGFTTGVDRITVDKATVTVGDTQRFPLYAKAGRDVLTFGTSTGFARFDSLSIVAPLSVETFETRKTQLGIGFALPTPALARAAPPVIVPPVKPLAINPMVSTLAEYLGYNPPPTRPKPQTPVALPPTSPPFYGSIFVYQGNDLVAPNRRLTQNINASLGYHTGGHCGRPYFELHASDFCPWTLDFHVDYNSSVFDSTFLENGYSAFLNQIGFVPGMAASLKASFGPISLTAELNGAIQRKSFFDSLGRKINIMPAAWQVSLGYQFDWNPWVEKIGEQGDFVAVTYSGTSGLAGATQLIGGQPTRVGFAPQARLSLTAGEWVLDGLKLAVEYTINWDYSIKDGGTGNIGNGLFSALTYNF
jgi:hypothetical protein